jgi:hypothetical protein
MAITLTERGNPPERFRGARITSACSIRCGRHPSRPVLPARGREGSRSAILLSYGVRQDRYGKDRSVLEELSAPMRNPG